MADYDFAGSFSAGVRARRDWEQTRSMIEDREKQKAAKALVEAHVARFNGAQSRLLLAEEARKQLEATIVAGQEPDPALVQQTWQEWGSALSGFQQTIGEANVRLVSEGASNPYVLEAGKYFIESSNMLMERVFKSIESAERSSMQAQQMRQEERRTQVAEETGSASASRDYAAAGQYGAEAARTRQTTEFEAGREPLVREGMAADIGATRAGTAAAIGAEARDADMHGSRKKFFEYGADLKGLSVEQARAKLDHDREQFRREEREWQRKDLLQFGALIREADAAGIPEDRVDELIREQAPGKSLSQFRSAHRGWSQEVTAELEALRQNRDLAAQDGDNESMAIFDREIKKLEQEKMIEARNAIVWRNITRDKNWVERVRILLTPKTGPMEAFGGAFDTRLERDKPIYERDSGKEAYEEAAQPEGPPDPERGGY